jgi:hypothetical protein
MLRSFEGIRVQLEAVKATDKKVRGGKAEALVFLRKEGGSQLRQIVLFCSPFFPAASKDIQ